MQQGKVALGHTATSPTPPSGAASSSTAARFSRPTAIPSDRALIARSSAQSFRCARHALNQVEGAYSLLSHHRRTLRRARSPRLPSPGARKTATPGGFTAWLVPGNLRVDLLNAQYVREIEPGEMVRISKSGISPSALRLKSIISSASSRTSILPHGQHYFGRSVTKPRNARASSRREHPVEADIVVRADSGVARRVGYALESKIPFAWPDPQPYNRRRTFIEPSQAIRNFGVKLKLIPSAA